MNNYDFDKLPERVKGSVKWEMPSLMFKGADKDALPFWIADMEFPLAKSIINALHKRVDAELFGYSYHNREELLIAITGWYKSEFNWEIDQSDIFYSNGIVPAINYCIEMFTNVNDGVIIMQPVYYPFINSINNHRRRIIDCSLIMSDGKYFIDFDLLEKQAREKTNKLLILCSPHNPIGRVWTREELRRISEICYRNSVVLISDEIHCDIRRSGAAHIPTILAGEEYKDNIITCTSVSKTFNLAGMQFSNIIITNPIYKKLWVDYTFNNFDLRFINPLSSTAVEAAYTGGREWLTEVLTYLDDNFKYVENFIKENLPDCKYTIPDATYFAWIDVSKYSIDDEIEQRIYEESKILVENGLQFGTEGRGFIRMNIACPRVMLAQGLQGLAKALINIRGRK